MHLEKFAENGEALKRQLNDLERKADTLMDRILSTTQPRLVTVYEGQFAQIENNKLLLQEKIDGMSQETNPKLPNFEKAYRTALAFLSNPHNLWASGRLEDRKAVLKLTFADNLIYDRNKGYRTAKTTLPFKVLEEANMPDCNLVRSRCLFLQKNLELSH